MSAGNDGLIAVTEGLRDPLARRVLREAIAAVLTAVNLKHCDTTSRYLVLDPQLAELDVSDPTQTPSVCNALGRTGVGLQHHWNMHAKVVKNSLNP